MTMAGLRVGVSAGPRGGELVEALTRLGARVVWAPTAEVASTPDGAGLTPDPGRSVPAAELLRALIAGELDAMAFISPLAVEGLFTVAASLDTETAVQAALAGRGPRRLLVAALGPATAEALERRGIGVRVCPLQARISALAGALAATQLGFGSFGRPDPVVLDPERRTVSGPGGIVELSDLQFALMASLARRPGITCPTSVLLREVWGESAPSGTASRRRLEVLASRLRARLAPVDVSIATVPKRGYRLEFDRPARSSEIPPVG